VKTRVNSIFYLVDDSLIDLKINERLLLQAGLASSVHRFITAESALDFFCTHPPPVPFGVILLDINMPGMNGFDLLDAMSQLPATIRSAYRIVMLSSTIDSEDLLRVNRHSEVAMLLSKPLNTTSLDEQLQQWQQDLPK
jgi:CheY-like chemotaxis protein